jgi:AraC-like DNA-binding protein/mannose-6-phosphate isomerase-like protein (cupin superfamily)
LSITVKNSLSSIFTQYTTGAFTIRARTGNYCLFHNPPENFWHYHEFHEICLVISGTGKHHLEKSEITLKAGDLFIADPGVFHLISSYDTKDLFLAFFTIEIIQNHEPDPSSRIDNLITGFLANHQLVSHSNEPQTHYLTLIDKKRSSIGNVCQEQSFLAWVFEALASLTNYHAKPPSEAADTKQKKLNKALEFIEGNLQKEIKIIEIANYIHASERTTRRIFQDLTGKTVIRVINEQKMKYIAHLLHQKYTLAQCADKLDHMSPAQLSKLFKKITGLSPKDYKESIKQPIYHPKLLKN